MCTDVHWNVYSHLLTVLNSFCQQYLHWSVGVENVCWECLRLLVDTTSEPMRWQKCLHLSFDRVNLFQFFWQYLHLTLCLCLSSKCFQISVDILSYQLTMCTNMLDIVYTCRGTVAACLLSVDTCRGTVAACLFTVSTLVEGQLLLVCWVSTLVEGQLLLVCWVSTLVEGQLPPVCLVLTPVEGQLPPVCSQCWHL